MTDEKKRPLEKADMQFIDRMTRLSSSSLHAAIRAYLDDNHVEYIASEMLTLPVIVTELEPRAEGDGHMAAAQILILTSVQKETTIAILDKAKDQLVKADFSRLYTAPTDA